MFGIIMRGLFIGIVLLLAIPMMTFATLIQVGYTLFYGIKDGDWCRDEWSEYGDRLEELWDDIQYFVLDY